MRRRLSAAAIGIWLVTGVMVFAAEVWEKPFTTWTPNDIKGLLADSPWAGKATLTHVTPGGEARPIDDTIVVRWESALPLRQAAMRELMGTSGTLTREMEAALASSWEFYEVAMKVDGMSAGIAARAPLPIGRETFIRREGKQPIAAVRVDTRLLDKNGKVIEKPAAPQGRGQAPGQPAAPGGAPPQGQAPPAPPAGGGGGGGFGGGGGGFGGGGGGSTVILFAFPKTDPITLADKEIEVVSKIGQYNVKKKFKIKDMVINGGPSL